MQIVIISDTHRLHEELGVLEGDVLIHCGDMLSLVERGPGDLEALDAWFGRQRFDLILCIGGNHDVELEATRRSTPQPFRNAHYLEDECLEHRGKLFYGAPWVPELRSHAFYKDENALARSWQEIPSGVDVLITHTPPFGILDRSSRGLTLGCPHLAAAVERIKPALHCFGHVHASAGVTVAGRTTFVNASSVSSAWRLTRAPFRIELE